MTELRAHAGRSLGICVSTPGGIGHVLGLVAAAARAGVSSEVFLTGDGVRLIRDRRFPALVATARVSVCDSSYRAAGLAGEVETGLADKDFVTQWRNAEMVERCDRYLIL